MDSFSVSDTRTRRLVQDLMSLAQIPSVSFSGFPREPLIQSAQAVAGLMRSRGLENVEVLELPGAHPYVYGERLRAPGAPTLLLYAHHDVQPPGRPEIWESPAFEPTLRQGPSGLRLFGRGTADDKAGIVVHTEAVSRLIEQSGELPVNVKVLIEGEEEIGSTHLPKFLEKYRSKLNADLMVLTDTSNFDCGVPGLTVALRGIVGAEIEVRSLTKTVHSGMWGGPLPDPVVALSKVLATLLDEEGRIAIPEIRRMIPDLQQTLNADEKRRYETLPFDERRFREQSGLVPTAQIVGEPGVHPWLRIWRQPSLSVNAIQASSRQQANNIINDVAWAKITVRVPPGMDAQKVSDALVRHLEASVPWGLEVVVTPEECGYPWLADWTQKSHAWAFECAQNALEKGYGKPPVLLGCGGSIPFVQPFTQALGGIPALLIGVEDPYTNAHGENESVLVSDLESAVRSQMALFEEVASAARR